MLEETGWNHAAFDDRHWTHPVETTFPGELLSQSAPPLKVRQVFSPISVKETQPGIYIYDFGQNASAIVSLKVRGEKGCTVTMRSAEYLTDDGLANQDNSGKNYYYSYTLSGKDSECWNPSFSYYGFRYVQGEGAVPEGIDNPLSLPVVEGLEMWHIRNNSETVGAFTCSNTLFNDIYRLIDWSVKSNMTSVLTDCPHREKLGWLEQVHLMSKSIVYNYDIRQMLYKTIRDMKDAQQPNGLITNTAPEYDIFSDDFRDSPEWGSAGVLVPWFLYTWYGDQSVLSENYDLMKKYVDYLTSRSTGHIVYHGLGDWCDLGPEHPGYSQLTSRGLTSTAIYYHDLCLLSRIAMIVGYEEDAAHYKSMAEEVKTAFNEKFFDKKKGYYDTGSQTANAMPLFLGLTPAEHYESVFNQLIKDIRSRDNSTTAGDVGFNYLLRILEKEGASDVIFDMNNQTNKPGYGYQLQQGATSLTESWNALKTASHNHFMLGQLMEWFYSGLGGIKPMNEEDYQAFKRFIIHPQMVGDITYAQVDFNSPYGIISNHWEKTSSGYRYQVRIPVNTSAYVYFPTTTPGGITANGLPVGEVENMVFVRKEKDALIYKVNSGHYDFYVESR
ncbi:MAG: glycoside hydrolase family 78 protein [Tannerellaceae bacterium]|nr:glycoside hydrolase family 78 protein [Tannerellaceae bacterium]